MAQQITVEQYHAALRTASVDNHPFMDRPNAVVVGKAFADMTHAVAAFVDAARFNDTIGYSEARSTLEDLVHTYPVLKKDEPEIRIMTLADLMEQLGDMFSTQDDAEDDAEAEEGK